MSRPCINYKLFSIRPCTYSQINKAGPLVSRTFFSSAKHTTTGSVKMSPLSPESAKAIARLRAYKPPPSSYGSLPLSRRAAVLILLYADPEGELKTVLTIRAKTLSSFAGHAAFPGGKADTENETAFETARREAAEEIGLPNIGKPLFPPFKVEHLCELPASLARNELVVRPCVAFLHSYNETTGETADPETSLIPRLDAKEVAAVFTARFHDFLKKDIEHAAGKEGDDEDGPGDWYQGSWTTWHESDWRMHNFYIPISEKSITKPRPQTRLKSIQKRIQDVAITKLKERERSGELSRYKVWGMTARILVDAARLAYDEEPEFEHNSHFGDEEIIAKLRRIGRLGAIRRPGDELTRETMRKAAKLS
ncbi:NUDIX domain protein [Talaromyces stipitatus ATCC 10500]|uniref:NUDIX domain protein n=1 Tax=Talaromyces stipitatus (strain ATCC 10500 / CBS 375.48 / QM 6759 / NRRL 1006) TaxID=441959 RepID=B8MT87_TALSN|nr:NUDIX domain protein [Talaromyces stipitatus ATCC 10500]EED12270.1 NUDIX domain protein [Talaromyces stipitatus ATCC 10500]